MKGNDGYTTESVVHHSIVCVMARQKANASFYATHYECPERGGEGEVLVQSRKRAAMLQPCSYSLHKWNRMILGYYASNMTKA